MTRPMDYLPQGYPAMAPYRDTRQAELALDEGVPMPHRLDPPPLRPAEPAELEAHGKLVTYPPPDSDHEARLKTLEATMTDVMRRLKALEARLVDPSA
jgi:hypothetical protein